MSCTKCDKKAYVEYKNKQYCNWYCAKKGNKQMFETILVWMFIIGFVSLSVYVIGNDGPDYNSKAYRDLDETIKNRNEVI